MNLKLVIMLILFTITVMKQNSNSWRWVSTAYLSMFQNKKKSIKLWKSVEVFFYYPSAVD